MKSYSHMCGLWLDRRPFVRNDLPVPDPANDEALVRVRLAGICGTDLEMIKGYYPFKGVLGHEFVGDIVEAPHAPDRVGDRVVGEINISCGACRACTMGRRTHCKQRSVLGIRNHDGAFAEYLCLPLKNLIPIPETISDEAAVFTEPLAAAFEILEQVKVGSTDRLLLIGAGRLGQLVAQVLNTTVGGLQVVARYPTQQKLLAEHGMEWIDESGIRPGTFDVVVEAVGSPEGLALARKAVRPQGTIVLKSTYKGSAQFNFSSLVVDEITLIGSRCGPFVPALSLLERKLVDPTPLVDARFPLHQALVALEKANEPGVLKVLLQVHP